MGLAEPAPLYVRLPMKQKLSWVAILVTYLPKNAFLALKALSINDQVLLELIFQTITTLRTCVTKNVGLSLPLSVSLCHRVFEKPVNQYLDSESY